MLAATPLTKFGRTITGEDRASRGGIRAELGHFVMKRLRRAAISLLDMRTEFETLAPGEAAVGTPRPASGLGLAIMRRVRRTASKVLDPWTEFAILD